MGLSGEINATAGAHVGAVTYSEVTPLCDSPGAGPRPHDPSIVCINHEVRSNRPDPAVLGGLFVVVPVVSVGAAPHPIAPSVESVPMPAAVTAASAAAGAPASASASAGSTAQTDLLESVLTRSTRGADVVGLSFPDRATAAGVTVQVRSKAAGRWGGWVTVTSDEGPDVGSAEARRARVASEPVGVAGSDEVQVHVRPRTAGTRLDGLSATFVDGGTSAADASLGNTPAASASAAPVQPTIITRAEWGADESLRTCSSPTYVASIKGAIVHHTGNANTYTAAAAPALLRSIHAYHVTGNGWCDVGYNFSSTVRPPLRGTLRRHLQERRRRPGGAASTRRRSASPPSRTTTPAPPVPSRRRRRC